ncbi:hypothetical protein Tco_1033897 [Tanacetum coccineum]
MNKKSHSFDMETFRDMLQICPILPGQRFEDPPFKEEILVFMRDLSYSRNIKSLFDVKVEILPQPWRTFGTIINKCLSGKVIGLDLFHLVYQIENKASKKNKDMYYPRFTKVIIDFFMSKDQSISRRNKVDWHMASDDPILTIMRFIPQHDIAQNYGAILPDNLTTQAMKESEEKTEQAPKASSIKRIKATTKVTRSGKKKQPAKGLETLSEIALFEAEQMKLVIERSKTQLHRSQPSDSGAHEGTDSSDEDDDDEASICKDDDDNAADDDDNDQNDVDEQTESNNDGDDFVHPKLTTHDDEERSDKEDNKDSFDPKVHTPSHVETTYDEETFGGNIKEETNEEVPMDEVCMDENVKLMGSEAEMIDAQVNQDTEDAHVTLTAEPPVVQQQSSSVSSGFISNMLNPNPDTGIVSVLNLNVESTSLQQTPVPTTSTALCTSLQNLPTFGSLFKFEDRVKDLEDDFSAFKQTNQFAIALSLIPSIVNNYLDSKLKDAVDVAVQLESDRLRDEAQAKNQDFINQIDENIKKIIKEQVKIQVKEQVNKILPRIEKSINEQLEAEFLIRSSNKPKTSHAVAASLSELELKKILIEKMENNKSIDKLDQKKTLYKALMTMKNPSLDQTGESKRRRTGKEPESTSAPKEKTTKSTGKSKDESKSHHRSTGKSAQVEEPILTAKDLEEPPHQEFEMGVTKDQHVDETSQLPDCTLAQKADHHESFNELMDTLLDFSAFVINRLKVDTLTLELLAGPTFELMKGSCKSLVELEYFFEEVYKVTTDQLDWNNPKGQQYPHDMRKPLPLILNSRGRQVISFDHFINNDLAYLSGGVSSPTYATSVTKTKAADYGRIK